MSVFANILELLGSRKAKLNSGPCRYLGFRVYGLGSSRFRVEGLRFRVHFAVNWMRGILSGLGPTSALRQFRATDLHVRDYALDGFCGGVEALKGSFPLARLAQYVLYVRFKAMILFNLRRPGGPCGGVYGGRGVCNVATCVRSTWGVIFRWVELSAPCSIGLGTRDVGAYLDFRAYNLGGPKSINNLYIRPESL